MVKIVHRSCPAVLLLLLHIPRGKDKNVQVGLGAPAGLGITKWRSMEKQNLAPVISASL